VLCQAALYGAHRQTKNFSKAAHTTPIPQQHHITFLNEIYGDGVVRAALEKVVLGVPPQHCSDQWRVTYLE